MEGGHDTACLTERTNFVQLQPVVDACCVEHMQARQCLDLFDLFCLAVRLHAHYTRISAYGQLRSFRLSEQSAGQGGDLVRRCFLDRC